MGQNTYSYNMPVAIPGSLVDMSPRSVVARANDATDGSIHFGMGVVKGATAGKTVKLPASGAVPADFEGVTIATSTETDITGKVVLEKGYSFSILQWGRAWVRVPEDLTIAYGEQVYLIPTGDTAGHFTNSATGNVAINAKFLGAAASGDIAPIEIFNAPYVAPATTA